MGRHTKYTRELGNEICERLAAGETLRAICRSEGMPDERRVRAWAADPEHEFAPQYARARETGYHKMADDLLHIADDNSCDTRTVFRDDEEIEVADTDVIARARLRVDTRKWLLSKALPKVYGEKSTVDVNATLSLSAEMERFLNGIAAGGAVAPPKADK